MFGCLISLVEDLELVLLKDFCVSSQLLKCVNLVQGPGLIILNWMTGTFVKVPA